MQKNDEELYGINELGIRVGESHQRAILSDADIDHIRQLREEGLPYKAIAARYPQVSIHSIGRYCRYERRAQNPTYYRRKRRS